MSECAALLSQKANRLRQYLEETQNLNSLISDEKAEDRAEYFAKIDAVVKKRTDIIGEIDEIDGLLVCHQMDEEKKRADVQRELWLCRKLLEQISDLEQNFKAVLERQISEEQRANGQARVSLRTASAYMQFDSGGSNFEWEK